VTKETEGMIKGNPFELLEALSDLHKLPYQLIERSMGYEYQFSSRKMPKEDFSSDEPPERLREKGEVITIDGYLGLYEPDKIRITIFKKGIEEVSEILKCKSFDLTYIVQLHEWAHGLMHVGLSRDDVVKVSKADNVFNEQIGIIDNVFRSMDDRLQEHLAQLITYQSLNTLQGEARSEISRKTIWRIVHVFKDLSRRQPLEYQVDDYLWITKYQLIKGITLIRNEWLKGCFEAWDMILKFHGSGM
jgi:hypothetical protein